MTLEFDVRHRLGAFTLDARFQAGPGVTALFGRSGSGKTTIVNVIAGLIRPDKGRVTAGGVPLVDTAADVFVPAHRRRVGYIFQDARLFPHLNVRQNLLYGAWFSQSRAASTDLMRVVDLLGLEALLSRSPGRLSGGEKQRVAIGRALLSAPRILLMDEPLAALDDARKLEIVPYLERLRDEAGVPIVYVTHAVAEVARLATTIVLVSEGTIAASGPALDVMGRIDLSPALADADAGALVESTVTSHDDRYDLTVLTSRAGEWRVRRLAAPAGQKVRLRVRASDVMLANAEPSGISALNVFAAVVADIASAQGGSVSERLDCRGDAIVARLTRYSVERLGLEKGSRVFALIKSVSIEQGVIGGRATASHTS